MYRLFIAIDLPQEIKKELARICFGLPGARWVPEEQLHLTLRFIGAVEGGIFRDIKEVLAAVRAEAFSLRLAGLGHFPPRRSPKVLWVGIERNERLVSLRKKVEAVLLRAGLQPDRRKFSAHITLARLKNTPLVKVVDFMAVNGLFESLPFAVTDFFLYSSVLTPKGAIHRIEEAYLLEKSA